MLPALEPHPHAKAVLGAALPPEGQASHAYLFHGPAGSGKRQAALEFAAALLSDGADDPAAARERVLHKVHPDLTWVAPSGAAGMLVDDIDEPVVAAATRTPFESRRRVFVLERADTLNDQAANKMLKTLEEPPDFAHLVLLADSTAGVLATIASRCQHVRFETPSIADVAARLGRHGVAGEQAEACARLAQGDVERALELALGEGPALRGAAEGLARACIRGDLASAPWKVLLEQSRTHGQLAADKEAERVAAAAEFLPDKEARRAKREGETIARRAQRRAFTQTLDQGLLLCGLWLRDVAALLDGAPDVVHHVDRMAELEQDAEAVGRPGPLREGVGLVEELRTLLVLNPSEELALEALASRLERLFA
ncbi:hypothetical protein [Conexibacter sp. SYSU D00693]|uniref:hypothetical protein n=1 Tax=Conexibacter sp. SYSU D00693 TaxID=2812560 RepID=UPI00196B2246|nr:hypothetical protein [Conexibacter sp. SYSU D00693]